VAFAGGVVFLKMEVNSGNLGVRQEEAQFIPEMGFRAKWDS
jgi:hypothetical protein